MAAPSSDQDFLSTSRTHYLRLSVARPDYGLKSRIQSDRTFQLQHYNGVIGALVFHFYPEQRPHLLTNA